MRTKVFVILTLMFLMLPLLSAASALPPGWGYDCNMHIGYGYSCYDTGHNNNPDKPLSVELSAACSDNVVTVTSSDSPVEGAHVAVIDQVPGGAVLFSGNSDADGKIHFSGCGMTVTVYANKGVGYSSVTKDTLALVDCGQCGECSTDDQCSSDKRCEAQKCVPVECSCGVASSHKCVNYECCSDTQCSGDKVCVDHSCKPKPETCFAPSCCTADTMCANNQNCLTVTGAPGSVNQKGQCHDITGQCGEAKDHKFVSYGYECGTEAGCPTCQQGMTCTDHKCVGSDLTGPQSGFVGDNAKVKATEADAPCIKCALQITGPDGKKLTGQTDANGNFDLPLTLKGNYTVALLKDGVIVKSIQVNALPKAAPEEGVKPSATQGGDLFSMLWVVLLLLVVVLGIYLYSRGRGKK